MIGKSNCRCDIVNFDDNNCHFCARKSTCEKLKEWQKLEDKRYSWNILGLIIFEHEVRNAIQD